MMEMMVSQEKSSKKKERLSVDQKLEETPGDSEFTHKWGTLRSMPSPRRRLPSQSSLQQDSLAFERRNRVRRLYEASLGGYVELLAQLLQEDRLILARASITCSDETPLHVACMLGHLEFAKALLAHKHNLTTELDSQGRTPLHLASANGYVEIARELLKSEPKACLIRDEDGRNPLHLAVMKGRSDVVRELVKARPEAAASRLSHGQTALHLGAMHNRLETLKVLVEMMSGVDLVNALDDEGNTVLHLAAADKQVETTKYLLQRSEVGVNTVNRNGFTALDIVEHFPRDFKVMELREMLVHAAALRAVTFPASTAHLAVLDNTAEKDSTIVVDLTSQAHPSANTPQVKAVPARSSSGNIKKQKEDTHVKWIKKKRDSLMVAATVMAAMAYQAGLNPPGGVWGDDQMNKHDQINYFAGTSIMAANYPYGYEKFWIYNTVSFIAALSTIFLLISGLPLRKKVLMWILMATMWVTITFMALTYLQSMKAILYLQYRDPAEMRPITKVVRNSMFVWLGVLASVFLLHTVRFLGIVLQIVKNPQKLKRQISQFVSWCRSRIHLKI